MFKGVLLGLFSCRVSKKKNKKNSYVGLGYMHILCKVSNYSTAILFYGSILMLKEQ